MDVKSSKPVTVSEASAIMQKRKEDGELGYEQTQALESSEKFAKLEPEKAKKVAHEIASGGKVSGELAAKIVDISPDNPATLKAILVKDKVELSDDEIAKILKELA